MTTAPRRTFYRPMRSRSATEPNRASTPLELLFDLCFVVAVAQSATGLEHAVAEHHFGHAVSAYAMVFFAIWWAWMNFTWFSSAYDADDDIFRLSVLIAIVGALIIAAGVPRAFDGDFLLVTIGYSIMRLANVGQWIRAAVSDPIHRTNATRYAIGVAAVQVGWWLWLLASGDAVYWAFGILVVAELMVPVWAERPGMTEWHPGHIAERYGLFTLIVLGETVLAASVAFENGLGGDANADVIWLGAAGIVIVFAMWWLYFDREGGLGGLSSFVWGYAHYLVFASAAAVGAGLVVNVAFHTGEAHISDTAAGYALAIPVATYLVSVWALHILPHERGLLLVTAPLGAVLILLAPLVPATAQVIALLMALVVAITVAPSRRAAALSTSESYPQATPPA
ncbi:low temperature requirement protein LtrA [Asanoa ferruginea]|uniref:Low temperature requirement protein LtrA n=1 Tax=Asanoa ferruginea TaxID=53367 RepID=A0A3D9ZZS0_9ACTN|nr:low temperature requirement protein A [Asanoa ferruginea]REG01644.1 low temperature requirement protein LtrA [Asanoa ferruginea]GIF52645.1 membrane protein [Asanoa ferruginea]